MINNVNDKEISTNSFVTVCKVLKKNSGCKLKV